MHLTLKKEASKPPGRNFLQQQARFDRWQQEYITKSGPTRPPAALSGRAAPHLSALLCRPATLENPLHDQTIAVTQYGRLRFGGRKINLSAVFAGQNVGVREVTDHVGLISLMHYDLGFFDDQCSRIECAPSPFRAHALRNKTLPVCPEQTWI